MGQGTFSKRFQAVIQAYRLLEEHKGRSVKVSPIDTAGEWIEDCEQHFRRAVSPSHATIRFAR